MALGRVDLWFGSSAWLGNVWIQTRWYSASHMGVLDELLEDELGLGKLEEQLGELDEDFLELGELYEQLGE